jgi:hypothetical protein
MNTGQRREIEIKQHGNGMTTYATFRTRCKTRHDFDDRIQVRYVHDDGEAYDTWVSGEEVLQRLRSERVERELRALGELNADDLRAARAALPEEAKRRLGDWLRGRFADGVDELVGGNMIGDSLSAAVRGTARPDLRNEVDARQKARWTTLLHNPIFRELVLELAWINLRGSFPETEMTEQPDDWI